MSIPIDNINICFVGGVSTGKSTLINSYFCEQLTECNIKRTTMVPTVYVENKNSEKILSKANNIFSTIKLVNKELIEKQDNWCKEDYNELIFDVGHLDINILQNSPACINIYDIPGLNDRKYKSKDLYYEYLKTNFYKFNVIIFIVDIKSALNTSDELDILNFIVDNTKKQLELYNKKIYTLVILNKADDMQLNQNSNMNLTLCPELNEMFEQAKNIVQNIFKTNNIFDQLINIIPLSAIDSYLYRMIKKHGTNYKLSPEQILKIGINEHGKKFSMLAFAEQEKKVYEILNDDNFSQLNNTMIELSGFIQMETILYDFFRLNNMSENMRIDNLLFNLKNTNNTDIDIIKYYASNECPRIFNNILLDLLTNHNLIYQKIKNINESIYNNAYDKLFESLVDIIKKKLISTNDSNSLYAYYTYYTYDKIDELLDDYTKLVNILHLYHNDLLCHHMMIPCLLSQNNINNTDTKSTDTKSTDATNTNIILYPLFIKKYIYSLILNMNKITDLFSLETFIYELDILKKINFICNNNTNTDTNTDNITPLINIIISKNKICMQIDNFSICEAGIFETKLLTKLSELNNLNIDLTQLLIFINLYKIKDDFYNNNFNMLFIKKMLYQKYEELPLQNYINILISGQYQKIDQNIIIQGLSNKFLCDLPLGLDLYYLTYINQN
jgi:GTP-binding protein EngB required for normal cell division